MFAQALAASLRILVFRAGPQDFPYAPALTPWIVGTAFAANLCVFVQAMPAALAAVMSASMVAGVAIATRGVLHARHLDNRYNQTLNALLLCTALLTLALAPPFASIAPQLHELATNPELMKNPERAQFPQGAVMMMNLLNFWNLAVTVFIYRQAANFGVAVSVLVTLVIAFSVMFFVVLMGSLVGGLLGLAA